MLFKKRQKMKKTQTSVMQTTGYTNAIHSDKEYRSDTQCMSASIQKHFCSFLFHHVSPVQCSSLPLSGCTVSSKLTGYEQHPWSLYQCFSECLNVFFSKVIAVHHPNHKGKTSNTATAQMLFIDFFNYII